MWVVALVVGAFFWKNPTAGALLLAYVVAELGLPIKYFTIPDIVTMAVIFAKPRYRPCASYWDLSIGAQLRCLITERTPADRFILLSIPLAWCIYSPVLTHSQWWSLWIIAVAQFLAAGWESLQGFRASHSIIRKHLGDVDALLCEIFIFPGVFSPVPQLRAADRNTVTGGGGDG
jgi:hypothetical protein